VGGKGGEGAAGGHEFGRQDGAPGSRSIWETTNPPAAAASSARISTAQKASPGPFFTTRTTRVGSFCIMRIRGAAGGRCRGIVGGAGSAAGFVSAPTTGGSPGRGGLGGGRGPRHCGARTGCRLRGRGGGGAVRGA